MSSASKLTTEDLIQHIRVSDTAAEEARRQGYQAAPELHGMFLSWDKLRLLADGVDRLALQVKYATPMADEVAVLVRRKVIDSRSPAADALLDFREPPSTPRADRLTAMTTTLDSVVAELKLLRRAAGRCDIWVCRVHPSERFIVEHYTKPEAEEQGCNPTRCRAVRPCVHDREDFGGQQ